MENERNRRIKILLERLQGSIIYLYGAGKRGKVTLDNLNTLGMGENVFGFIDDNRCGRYCSKNVYSCEDIVNFKDTKTVFIIATYSVSIMACKLVEKGIPPRNIFFLPELLIDDVDTDVFRRNKEKIEKTYDSLEDNISKYIYSSLFEVYRSGNIGILSRTKGEIQYFPVKGTRGEIEKFHLSGEESFCDCGAYDGDTIREFKNRTGNQYKKIWALEPDAYNYRMLSDYISKEKDMRIESFCGGAYSSDGIMAFKGDAGTSSTLDFDGSESIKVYRIDSIINEPVSFIKMDIEGAEKEAILGAKETILKYEPKLAICIYHKVEDLWEIPLLIKKIDPDYHIYIRNYEDRIDETVCYAIPSAG